LPPPARRIDLAIASRSARATDTGIAAPPMAAVFGLIGVATGVPRPAGLTGGIGPAGGGVDGGPNGMDGATGPPIMGPPLTGGGGGAGAPPTGPPEAPGKEDGGGAGADWSMIGADTGGDDGDTGGAEAACTGGLFAAASAIPCPKAWAGV
jgi:hypothetical protein